MLFVISLLLWWHWPLHQVWASIWFVATSGVGIWTWIWPMRHCGLGQEMACWFQCWKNSTCFVWKVSQHWCYWCENGWVCFWRKKQLLIWGDCLFSSELDCDSCTVSIAKTAKKNWSLAWFHEVSPYLYKSNIRPCKEYRCCFWEGTPSCYLDMLNKL